MTMRKAGSRFSEIGCALGVDYMTVSKWWDRDQDGGADTLAAQKRGPRWGRIVVWRPSRSRRSGAPLRTRRPIR